jgi:hypothetical protein
MILAPSLDSRSNFFHAFSNLWIWTFANNGEITPP